jgi:alanine dehydrogenase
MRIGVPKEIKDNEYRVGLISSSVAELVQHGHDVIVESGGGIGAGIDDVAYRDAGATLCEGPDLIFETAELIVKVKEPQPVERSKLRPGQILFTYFHLAPDVITHPIFSAPIGGAAADFRVPLATDSNL